MIESLIVDAIESTTFDVTAKNIYEYIDTKRKNELLPPISLDRVTQILLDNTQFQLAPGCVDGTSPDAVWTIVSDNDPVDFHESQDPPSQQLLRREASFQRETFSKSVVSARDALGIEWFYVISLDVNSQPTEVNIQRDYERFSQLQFGDTVRFNQTRKRSFDDYGIEPRALKRLRTTEYMIEREVSTASLTVSDILDLGKFIWRCGVGYSKGCTVLCRRDIYHFSDLGSPQPYDKEATKIIPPSRGTPLTEWTESGPLKIGAQIACLKLNPWQ